MFHIILIKIEWKKQKKTNKKTKIGANLRLQIFLFGKKTIIIIIIITIKKIKLLFSSAGKNYIILKDFNISSCEITGYPMNEFT